MINNYVDVIVKVKTITCLLLQSTLLQGILGELKAVKGSVEVRGEVSYCSQEPWVFSGTLRDNILFGNDFDPDHYKSVLESCALDKVYCNLSVNEHSE